MNTFSATPIIVILKNGSANMFYTMSDLFNQTEIHEEIIELSISDRRMTHVPNEIELFINMERFNCANNLLEVLPFTITNLVKLKELILVNNRLVILPSDIGELKQLKRIDAQINRIDSLPPSFEQLDNLTYLNLSYNNFRIFPEKSCKLKNLKMLYMNGNRIKIIPDINLNSIEALYLNTNRICNISDTIGNLVHLKNLELQDNCIAKIPETIGELACLETLSLSNNVYLSSIPRTIGGCRQLTRIHLENNQLERLPVEITQCVRLTEIHINDNPIELGPIVQRFVNHRRNINNHTGLYRNRENVHTTSIQQSIKESIINLLNDTFIMQKTELTDAIVNHHSISPKNKDLLCAYINDENDSHSTLYCTFFDVFMKVYGRILSAPTYEIYKRLDEELNEGECKCFTGRLSRIVNVLNGFFDDIRVSISENEQISNVIITLRQIHGLSANDEMTDDIKDRIRQELTERGYEDDIIEVWLSV